MSIENPTTNAEKRDFLGSIIVGALAKKGVEKAIGAALDKVAKDNNVPMSQEAVPVAKKEVITEVKEELQARAEHRLDIEPHLSSRNIWGSIVGIITAAETIRIYWTDGQVQTVQEWLIPVGIIVAAFTPLYSRFIAKKPLWR